MPSYRPARVAEMIHRELAQRLREEIKDPELTDISITKVDVSRDLGRATVWYLPLGGGEVTEGLRGAVDRAARRLRGPVGRALRLRTAPELVFEVDPHTDEAVRITSLLGRIGEELRESEAADDPEAGGEE